MLLEAAPMIETVSGTQQEEGSEGSEGKKNVLIILIFF